MKFFDRRPGAEPVRPVMMRAECDVLCDGLAVVLDHYGRRGDDVAHDRFHYVVSHILSEFDVVDGSPWEER